MITANLDKMNNKSEHAKDGEIVDHYRLRISCGDNHAALLFCPGGRHESLAIELRKMADILEGNDA